MDLNLSQFDFELPKNLIAYYPLKPRDSSQLLVIGHRLEQKLFSDLPILLNPDDLLVFNDSKVIPARLFGKKGEAKIEFLLHRKLANGNWESFAKPARKLKPGDIIMFEKGLSCIITAKHKSGEVELKFNDESTIKDIGETPLPPYIKRTAEKADAADYQTIYAAPEGSVAAPTAGLHFTKELMEKIPNKAFITLHIGAGTFQPVKSENLAAHKMHSEYYEIPPAAAEAIRKTKTKGGRVIAVGTTSLRVLEASNGKASQGETDIFIKPGYEFKIVDALVTNFHLPKSTLFILACALAGMERMKEAYTFAIENNYRFFSYGDACFITKANA